MILLIIARKLPKRVLRERERKIVGRTEDSVERLASLFAIRRY